MRSHQPAMKSIEAADQHAGGAELDSTKRTSFDAVARLFYHTFFQGIDFHCNVMDRNYRIVWHNRVEPEKRRPGLLCHEFYYKKADPCEVCSVRNVFISGKPCCLKRKMFDRLPDGRARWAEIRAYPIRDRGVNVEFVITIGFEITDRKYALECSKTMDCRTAGSVEKVGRPARTRIPPKKRRGSRLTAREIQVVSLMAEGYSNLDIAEILSLSPHTVKSHTVHIFNKLGVNDRTAAAILASRLNLI